MTVPRIIPIGLAIVIGLSVPARDLRGQTPGGNAVREADGALPKDVNPISRSRLAPVKREDLDERQKRTFDAAPNGPEGAAALRLHSSGTAVRWQSGLGRDLTELGVIALAREYDQPYEWSLHAMEALAVGLDPSVMEVVRDRKPVTGLGEKEAIIIQLERDVFGKHRLSADTYARAVSILGERNLVDLVDLVSGWARFAPSLTAFNQHMPPGWKQTLPLPFTQPDDIHPDSRNRLPLILRPAGAQQAAPALYSRTLSPAGTGPGQISSHGKGQKALEASVGRRMMDVAILIAARELDQQYDWTLSEAAALKDGLEPAIIDVIRVRKPVTGLAEKEAALITFGRELFGKHVVSADTYARTIKAFGETDLVDTVALMAEHAADAAMLTAFDQHLPAGSKPLLPMQ